MPKSNDEPIEYKFHPITEIWPKMTKAEFAELVESIKAHGLQNPIWLHPDDGSIIDGRQRYLACLEAGVEPRFQIWDGAGSLAEFSVRQNYAHFIPGQCPIDDPDWARRALNVSPDRMRRVEAVKEISPELIDEISKGTKTLREAEEILGLV
jgi:hypothetical protein